MKDDARLIKKGDQIKETMLPGKYYRLMVKSTNMESIIAELVPHTESKWFKHSGEEMHLVLQGAMEYTVGDHTYNLSEGDVLWHKSTLKHRAKNIGDITVVYITVGTPPTFMFDQV